MRVEQHSVAIMLSGNISGCIIAFRRNCDTWCNILSWIGDKRQNAMCRTVSRRASSCITAPVDPTVYAKTKKIKNANHLEKIASVINYEATPVHLHESSRWCFKDAVKGERNRINFASLACVLCINQLPSTQFRCHTPSWSST